MTNWLNGATGPVPAFAAAGVGNAAPEQEKQHNWHLAGSSYSRDRLRGGGAGQFHAPQKPGMTRRAILALVLLVLLPPVGIAMMWYKGIFAVRGRVLLTVVGTIIMTVMFGFLMPRNTVVEIQPSAVKASLRTPLPTDAALNALSNMDELLAGIENTTVVQSDYNEATGQTVAEDATVEATPEPEDPMAAVVYSVRSGAKYYHKASECNGQVNRRTLTVAQALNEGLKACGRCDPPEP